MKMQIVERHWHWLDDGVLPYALALMRAIWIWLLLHFFSMWVQSERGDMVAPLTLFGLLAVSTLLTQIGTYKVKRAWPAALLVMLGGLAALALTLYLEFGAGYAIWQPGWLHVMATNALPAIMTLILVVFLWRWGILAGRNRVYYDTYAANFTIGAYAMALGVAVTYATRIIPPNQALLTLMFYFAVGLGTLAIASLQTTRSFETKRSQQAVAVNRYWLGTVAVIIVAVLAAGLLLDQLFAPGVIARVLGVMQVVLGLVGQGLLWVLWVVTYPLFLLLDWLRKRIPSNEKPADQQQPLQTPSFADQLKNVQQQPAAHLAPGVYLALQILAGLIVVGAIALIFYLTYRRFRSLAEEDVEETRDLILSRDLLQEQLAELFGRRRRKPAPAPPPFAIINGEDPVAQIRRTYQSMLAWAALRGAPRRPDLTPDEYGQLLATAAPDAGESIGVITAAYLQARYSSAPVPAERATEAARAWAQITAAEQAASR
jgi:hypothetical protein